jgi:hypothetical protein
MPRNENEEEMVDEDWVEDCDQDTYDFENEDDTERKLVFNNMCSDDEDEQSSSHINARYKKRIVKNIFVNLPRMSNEDAPPQEESKEDTGVKLNLQSGGWSVKKVEVDEMASALPSLSDSKLQTPKKKFSASRDGGWKKMTDFFSSIEEQNYNQAPPPPPPQATQEDEFKVVRKSKDRVPRVAPVVVEERRLQLETPRNMKCTKMCNSGKDCKRPGCNFAHSMEEFNPITCRFQSRCNNKEKCTFKHDAETKENYLLRLQTLQK